jgi:hypothetical protein
MHFGKIHRLAIYIMCSLMISSIRYEKELFG